MAGPSDSITHGLPNSLLFGAMGSLTDLTVPDVRLGLARPLPALRLADLTPRRPDCRTRIRRR
jgi:hypothetical protein